MDAASIIDIIAEGGGALNSALDAYKKLRQAAQRGQLTQAEIAAKLLEIYDQLLDAKEAQTRLHDEVQLLVTDLQKAKNWQEDLTRYRLVQTPDGGVVYEFKGPVTEDEAAHYICPKCVADEKKSHLQPNGAVLRCPRCEQNFRNAGSAAGPIVRGGRRNWAP